MIGGAESETTLKRNRMALDSLAFRPRVLRDVSSADCSGSLFGRKLRLPVMLAPVGSIQRFDPEGCAAVARAAAQFGVPQMVSSVSRARPRSDRGRRQWAESLPALRARRRRLGRGHHRPRDGGGLRRLCIHGRRCDLQPSRTRHRQARRDANVSGCHRPALPGVAELGSDQAVPAAMQAAADHQGHPDRRRRDHRLRSRRRRHLCHQPRRPAARPRAWDDRHPAGGCGCRARPRTDHRGWGILPRHRRDQGYCARGRCRVDRPALSLWTCRRRTGRRSPRAGTARNGNPYRAGTTRRHQLCRGRQVMPAARRHL